MPSTPGPSPPRRWPSCSRHRRWLGWWRLEAWQARRDAEARDLIELTPVAIDEVMGSMIRSRTSVAVDVSAEPAPRARLGPDGADGRDGLDRDPLSSRDRHRGVVRPRLSESPRRAPRAAKLDRLVQPRGTGRRRRPDDVAQLRIADAVQRVDADLYGAYVVARSWPGLQAPASVAAGGEQLHRAEELLYAVEW